MAFEYLTFATLHNSFCFGGISVINCMGNDFIQKVIVRIFDHFAHEVNRNLSGVHNLLGRYDDIFNISVFVLGFHNHVSVISRKVVFIFIRALPFLFSNNCL